MSVSIQKMIDAGVHFGHQTKFWNPRMKQYIFGVRNKIHIINLDKTVVLFEEALKFTDKVVKNKGSVLFVGTRSQASDIICSEAMRAGMPYVNHRWLGGMLTNFETVKKSIKKLEVKSALLEKHADNKLSKKEVLDLTREIAKLKSSIGGISEMKDLPSALFIIDTGCHEIAIKEAKKLGIPVIGVVDTNNDPSIVDYAIPGNDDSAKSIQLYAEAFANTIIKAKESGVAEIVHSKVEMVEEEATKPKTVRKVKKTDDADVESEKPAKVTKAKKVDTAEVAEEKPAKKTAKESAEA